MTIAHDLMTADRLTDQRLYALGGFRTAHVWRFPDNSLLYETPDGYIPAAPVSFLHFDRDVGDYVTVTLAPDCRRTFQYHEVHEEGYSERVVEYTYDALSQCVRLALWDHGRDCDGYSSHAADLSCPLNRLANCWNYDQTHLLPAWS